MFSLIIYTVNRIFLSRVGIMFCLLQFFSSQLLAKDIYAFLSDKATTITNFHEILIENQKCSFSLQLLKPSKKPIVSFVSSDSIKKNKVTAWWEIKELPRAFDGSTFNH